MNEESTERLMACHQSPTQRQDHLVPSTGSADGALTGDNSDPRHWHSHVADIENAGASQSEGAPPPADQNQENDDEILIEEQEQVDLMRNHMGQAERGQEVIPVRHNGELFEVYRDQVLQGDFELQRAFMKNKICSCMFNLMCEALLTLWLFLYLPRLPSSSLYLAEKIWLASWIIS